MFKRVVLFLRPEQNPAATQTQRAVAEFLRRCGAKTHIAEDKRTSKQRDEASAETLRHCDLVIAVGGDGTLLHAARVLGRHLAIPGSGEKTSAPPLLGINTGRLGFLTDIPAKNFTTPLEKIFAGAYSVEQRSILGGRVLRAETLLHEQIAINEIGVFKHNVARLIELETWIDDHLVLRERADGVIVATPTGSTAYAMASGGPILHPGLHALELVPVCPLTLSHRPLVLPGASRISFRITGHDQDTANLTFDGHTVDKFLQLGDEVRIQAIPAALHLLHPESYDYYDGLRDKLHWGLPPC